MLRRLSVSLRVLTGRFVQCRCVPLLFLRALSAVGYTTSHQGMDFADVRLEQMLETSGIDRKGQCCRNLRSSTGVW